MTALIKIISEEEPIVQKQLEEVEKATSVCKMIMAAWKLGQMLMVMLVEEILAQRAKEKTQWPNCEKCGNQLQSKGFVERQILCILGTIRWKRRIGRCPKGCHIGQIAPLDEQLAIAPHQQTSMELKKIGSSLAVFVAYETAANLMKQIIGIELSSSSIWQWVQTSGKQAKQWIEKEMLEMAQGQMPKEEQIEAIACLQEALAIYDQVFPANHPWVTKLLNTYSQLLLKLNRNNEAQPLLDRIASLNLSD